MDIYSYSQFAPYFIAVLCLVGMLGIPKPTVQNPNTWHMTFLIVFFFSVLNIVLNFALEPIQSEEHYAAMKKLMGAWDAKKAYLQIFAWSWVLMALMDALTGYLIFKYSQKGHKSMSIILGLFLLVNVMAVTDVVAFTEYNYDLGAFSSILAITDIAHEDYVECILILNILQISFLLGGLSGWSISNTRERIASIVGAYRDRRLVARGSAGLSNIRRQPDCEGLA